jgi:hypothetical protein
VNVFDVPPIEVCCRFFLDGCSLTKKKTALFFLNLHVSQRHLFMQLFYTTLHFKDLAFTFFLSPQSLHHHSAKLLTQVFALLPLRLHCGLGLPNGIFKCQTLILPSITVDCCSGQGCPVPDGLPAESEFNDILTNLRQFVPTVALIAQSVPEVVLKALMLLCHH